MTKIVTPFERLFAIMINPLIVASYIGLVILSFFYLDKPIAYYFHSIDLNNNFYILNWLTHIGSSGLCISVLFLLALFFRYIQHNKAAEQRTWFLVLCVFLPTVICLVLKIILGRARPELLFSDHLYGFYGFHTQSLFWSLPSGHTTTVTGLIFGLIILFPRYVYVFLLAGIVGVSTRILLTQHFLSDVLTAAYLALLEIGFLMWWLRRQNYLVKLLQVR
jgi:membrane-associated phospholipid phosphatase